MESLFKRKSSFAALFFVCWVDILGCGGNTPDPAAPLPGFYATTSSIGQNDCHTEENVFDHLVFEVTLTPDQVKFAVASSGSLVFQRSGVDFWQTYSHVPVDHGVVRDVERTGHWDQPTRFVMDQTEMRYCGTSECPEEFHACTTAWHIEGNLQL